MSVGEEVKLSCDVKTEPEGKIVWKAGHRVMFAGDLRIKRDNRLSLDNNDLVICRVRAVMVVNIVVRQRHWVEMF